MSCWVCVLGTGITLNSGANVFNDHGIVNTYAAWQQTILGALLIAACALLLVGAACTARYKRA